MRGRVGQAWTGEDCVGDAMVAMLARLPRAKWLLTTCGRDGSILLERPARGVAAPCGAAVLQDALDELGTELRAGVDAAGGQADRAGCTSTAGATIRHAAALNQGCVKEGFL